MWKPATLIVVVGLMAACDSSAERVASSSSPVTTANTGSAPASSVPPAFTTTSAAAAVTTSSTARPCREDAERTRPQGVTPDVWAEAVALFVRPECGWVAGVDAVGVGNKEDGQPVVSLIGFGDVITDLAARIRPLGIEVQLVDNGGTPFQTVPGGSG